MSNQNDDSRSETKKTTAPFGISELTLRGHVYMIGIDNQADKFNRTNQAVAEHVGRVHGAPYYRVMIHLVEPEFKKPDRPTGNDAKDAVIMETYRMDYRHHQEKRDTYLATKGKVFMIIFGQCHYAMKNALKSLGSEWKVMEAEGDVVGLVKTMRNLAHMTQHKQQPYWALQSSLRTLFTMCQGPKEDLVNYSERFLSQADAVETGWGGKLFPQLAKDKNEDEQDAARNKLLACVFLAGAHRQQHKKAIDDLHNDFMSKEDNYPVDVTKMLEFLNGYRGMGGAANQRKENLSDGVVGNFHQTVDINKVKCNKCKKKGHYAKDCNEGASDSETQDDNNSQTQTQWKTKGPWGH